MLTFQSAVTEICRTAAKRELSYAPPAAELSGLGGWSETDLFEEVQEIASHLVAALKSHALHLQGCLRRSPSRSRGCETEVMQSSSIRERLLQAQPCLVVLQVRISRKAEPDAALLTSTNSMSSLAGSSLP